MVLKSIHQLPYIAKRFTGNEKKLLKILLKNSRTSDVELGHYLKISSQAASKIRKKMENLGIIKRYLVEIDYSKIGVQVLALTMIEVHDASSAEAKELFDVLRNRVINLSKLLLNNDSYIALFGFHSLDEVHEFFNDLRQRFPKSFKLRNLYLFHVGGFYKNSSKELYQKALTRTDNFEMSTPKKVSPYIYPKKKYSTEYLSPNEKKVLRTLLTHGRFFYNQLSQSLVPKKLSARGICKIKERLEKLGVIKGYTIDLDYSKLDLGVFAFVFIKKKITSGELHQGLERWAELSENIIESYGLHDGSLQAFFCGFKNLEELEYYWKTFEQLNGEFFEIKKIHISSSQGCLRSNNYFYERRII